MATTETADTVALDPKRDRLVITASSLGTVFEWYDFFVYGILAATIGKLFFPADNPALSTLASLVAFGVGFGVSAILFGLFEMWFLVPLPKGPIEALFGY